jgi:hypothetical protein
MNDNVTMEQLVTAMECWNIMHAGKQTPEGGASYDVQDILAGAALFASEDTKWQFIPDGPLKGSRFCKTKFGYVVQSPKPSNEMSLMQENMARMCGVPCGTTLKMK